MFEPKTILAIFLLCVSVSACPPSRAGADAYVWENITPQAAFPAGYNYPVFAMNGEMRALNGGGWTSRDGKSWTKSGLPDIGLNSAYQRYVPLGDALYALGAMEGNYLNFRLSTKISRTRDFRSWETLAEKSNLPERVFYGALAFQDKIWLFGGWDGKRYYNDVWHSADGVNWTKAAENAAWSPRAPGVMIVFKGRIWLFGGGVIDGDAPNNPHAGKEVWTSADGVRWQPVEPRGKRPTGGAPVVFDGKLWMVGANRDNGDFGSAVFVSADGVDWRELSAPWSPRGGTAVWVFGDRLFMTGGKYSYNDNGALKFVYSNDVWAMRRKTEN